MRVQKLAAAILALGLLVGHPALAQNPEEGKEETRSRPEQAPPSAVPEMPRVETRTEGDNLEDQLSEARLNVELLTIEHQAIKNQLTNQAQVLTQFKFGGMGGGMGGMAMLAAGPIIVGDGGGHVSSPEAANTQREKMVASMSTQVENLKRAALETSKKLIREQTRVDELEQRINGRPGSAPAVVVPAEIPAAVAEVAAPFAALPSIEQRLKNVEQKLDRILKDLESLKPAQTDRRRFQ